MPIAVACPSCNIKLKAPDTMVGKKVKCPKCQAPLTVAAPPAEVDSDNLVVAARANPVAEIATSAAGRAASKDCPFCGEAVLATAKKCKHCGEIIDVALRSAEEAKRAVEKSSPMVFMNAGGAASSSAAASAAAASGDRQTKGEKSRMTAAILALFLGWLGIHKFYLGQSFQGVLYLCASLVGVSFILGIIDGIGFLNMSDRKFAELYG